MWAESHSSNPRNVYLDSERQKRMAFCYARRASMGVFTAKIATIVVVALAVSRGTASEHVSSNLYK